MDPFQQNVFGQQTNNLGQQLPMNQQPSMNQQPHFGGEDLSGVHDNVPDFFGSGDDAERKQSQQKQPSSPVFGTANPTTQNTAFGAPSAFGVGNQNAFGAASQNAFGGGDTNTFGAANQNAFGGGGGSMNKTHRKHVDIPAVELHIDPEDLKTDVIMQRQPSENSLGRAARSSTLAGQNTMDAVRTHDSKIGLFVQTRGGGGAPLTREFKEVRPELAHKYGIQQQKQGSATVNQRKMFGPDRGSALLPGGGPLSAVDMTSAVKTEEPLPGQPTTEGAEAAQDLKTKGERKQYDVDQVLRFQNMCKDLSVNTLKALSLDFESCFLALEKPLDREILDLVVQSEMTQSTMDVTFFAFQAILLASSMLSLYVVFGYWDQADSLVNLVRLFEPGLSRLTLAAAQIAAVGACLRLVKAQEHFSAFEAYENNYALVKQMLLAENGGLSDTITHPRSPNNSQTGQVKHISALAYANRNLDFVSLTQNYTNFRVLLENRLPIVKQCTLGGFLAATNMVIVLMCILTGYDDMRIKYGNVKDINNCNTAQKAELKTLFGSRRRNLSIFRDDYKRNEYDEYELHQYDDDDSLGSYSYPGRSALQRIEEDLSDEPEYSEWKYYHSISSSRGDQRSLQTATTDRKSYCDCTCSKCCWKTEEETARFKESTEFTAWRFQKLLTSILALIAFILAINERQTPFYFCTFPVLLPKGL